MRSNANVFRAYAHVENQMLVAVMPRLATAAEVLAAESDRLAPPLRVALGSVAGTRLYGFRTAQEGVQ